MRRFAALGLIVTAGCGRVPLGERACGDGSVNADAADPDSETTPDGAGDGQSVSLAMTVASGSGQGWASAVVGLDDGGTVVVGSFEGELTFAAGRKLTSRGENDAFVARYRRDGALAWVRQIGDLGYDAATGVAAVGFDEIVVTGFFLGSAIFDEGGSTRPPLFLTSSGPRDQDCFLARLASDGSVRWARQIAGPGQETCRAAAGTPLGEAYVTGAVNGGAVFGPGETTQTTAGTRDGPMFVALYSSDGSLAWVRFAGTEANGQGYDVATVGAESGALIAGYFNGTALFGAGLDTVSLSQKSGGAYLARYSRQGTLMWARQMAGERGIASSVDVDADARILVSGSFDKSGTFGAGEDGQVTLTDGANASAGFLARFDGDGTFKTATKLSGVIPARARWLHDGGVAVLGAFGGALVVGPTSDDDHGVLLSSRGESDVALMRFDGAGWLRWAAQIGGPGGDFPGGLAESRDFRLWAVGAAAETVVLSAPGVAPVQSAAALDGSPFVARFAEPPLP